MEYFKLHFEYFIFTVGIVCSFYEVYYAWTVYFFLFWSNKQAAYCKKLQIMFR